jgi:hypothetical protein
VDQYARSDTKKLKHFIYKWLARKEHDKLITLSSLSEIKWITDKWKSTNCVTNWTSIDMDMTVFWVVAPCSLVVCRRFRGSCCLHRQGDEWSPWWWRQQAPLERWFASTRLHGATTQKTAIFTLASVRTSYLTKYGYVLNMNLQAVSCKAARPSPFYSLRNIE